MTQVEQEILTALKTYQWTETAVVYNFARHLNYCESYVYRYLQNLVLEGQIERVREGVIAGRPRYIYKLIKKV